MAERVKGRRILPGSISGLPLGEHRKGRFAQEKTMTPVLNLRSTQVMVSGSPEI